MRKPETWEEIPLFELPPLEAPEDVLTPEDRHVLGVAQRDLWEKKYGAPIASTEKAKQDRIEGADWGALKIDKVNPRHLPLDLIYCWGRAEGSCCMAVQCGWKYGFRSWNFRVCPHSQINPATGKLSKPGHQVVFIDNAFHHYVHEEHLAVVKEHRPKYATVMDAMTPEQCKAAGVESWSSLEQILEWAEELAEYAENVILIPKHDVFDRIPEKFMVGLSVPTSYGGTPVDIPKYPVRDGTPMGLLNAFKGRRVHLLGGSWSNQLRFLRHLRDDVKSIDNNHINHMSLYGQFQMPDGSHKVLHEVGLEHVVNPRMVALNLSFGGIAKGVIDLHGEGEWTVDPQWDDPSLD